MEHHPHGIETRRVGCVKGKLLEATRARKQDDSRSAFSPLGDAPFGDRALAPNGELDRAVFSRDMSVEHCDVSLARIAL